MAEGVGVNSRTAIAERRAAGLLTWPGPVLMLFARTVLSVVAMGLVAAGYALRGATAPWYAAAGWFPVYATLVDLGCLGLLWMLTRRERIAVVDLISFERRRWKRDVALGLGLIPVSLVFILGGISASSVVVFGTAQPTAPFRPLPLLPALFGVLVFPLIWGFTEQMTYNGYILPRLQVLWGRTVTAVALVSFIWSLQHAVQPLTFDPKFMLYRLLAPIPFSLFITTVYLRIRRLLPLAVAHWLMDAADVLRTVLLPGLR